MTLVTGQDEIRAGWEWHNNRLVYMGCSHGTGPGDCIMDDPHGAKIIQQDGAAKTLHTVLSMVKTFTDPYVAGVYSAETLALAMKDIQEVIEGTRE